MENGTTWTPAWTPPSDMPNGVSVAQLSCGGATPFAPTTASASFSLHMVGTWTADPSDPYLIPPPSCVILHETSTAGAGGTNGLGQSFNGKVNDGCSDPDPGTGSVSTLSGGKYSVVQLQNGATTLTIDRALSASMTAQPNPSYFSGPPNYQYIVGISSGGAGVGPYTLSVANVGVDITGGIGLATRHFMIGQWVYAALDKGNLPNLSTDSYSWSVSGGKAFDNYAAFNDHAQYLPLFSTQSSTASYMSCYFAKPEKATFTCQANVMGLPVTVTRDVLLDKPSVELAIQMGTVDDLPDSPNPSYVELRRLYKNEILPDSDAAGIEWTGNVLTPIVYNGYEDVGQWNWTQLVTSMRQVQAGAVWEKIAVGAWGNYKSVYGVQGLDGTYPYAYWYPADGTDNGNADSPNQLLDSTYNVVSVNDSFQDYLMYLPPGSNSVVVPLKETDWFWQAHATNSAGVWATSNKNAQWGFGNDFPDHPVWTWAMPTNPTLITYIP